MRTLEQFIEEISSVREGILNRNRRVYHLLTEDYEDLRSFLNLCLIRWWNRYPQHQQASIGHLRGLVGYHLNHKVQDYIKNTVKHWVPGPRLDSPDNHVEMDDPQQLRNVLSAEAKWVHKAIALLPAEDQEIINYWLKQDDKHRAECSYAFGEGRTVVALGRLKKVTECLLEGTPLPRFRQRPNPHRFSAPKPRPQYKTPVWARKKKVITWEMKRKPSYGTLRELFLVELLKGTQSVRDIARTLSMRPCNLSVSAYALQSNNLITPLSPGEWQLTEVGREEALKLHDRWVREGFISPFANEPQ
jgi:hypothetical protein